MFYDYIGNSVISITQTVTVRNTTNNSNVLAQPSNNTISHFLVSAGLNYKMETPLPREILDIILRYKRDMELLEHMEEKFNLQLHDLSISSLQTRLMNNYIELVTDFTERDVNAPFDLLDQYSDAQTILRQRLRLWNISEKGVLNDKLWRGLVVNFILFFMEARLLE
jgi:hypothetical protein